MEIHFLLHFYFFTIISTVGHQRCRKVRAATPASRADRRHPSPLRGLIIANNYSFALRRPMNALSLQICCTPLIDKSHSTR